MKNQQYWLVIVLAFVFFSCSRTNADVNSSTTLKAEDNPQQSDIERSTTSDSKVQLELNKAKKEGKAVFVVITGKENTDIDKAHQIVKEAIKIYGSSTTLQLNRDDASNATLVKDWGLSGIPVPFIIVVSPLGIPSGGLPVAEATAESIAAFVPSPKLDQVYQGVNNGKNVIVLFTKSSFANSSKAKLNCQDAMKQLNNDAVLVEVDMTDPKEFAFMTNFKIDREKSKEPVTMVINKAGQIAATFNTIPESSKIVASAKSPVAKPCCPGGSSAGCEPK